LNIAETAAVTSVTINGHAGEFIYWMQSPIGQATQLPLDEWTRIAESLE